MEGLLSTGPTPSSFTQKIYFEGSSSCCSYKYEDVGQSNSLQLIYFSGIVIEIFIMDTVHIIKPIINYRL